VQMTRRPLACAALVLGALASPAFAQNAKVSPSGTYLATLTCGGGGTNSGLLQVWDASGPALTPIEMFCNQSYEVGSGAVTMHYLLRVYAAAGNLVKRCESPATVAIREGRFSCKGSGKASAALGIQAQ